MRKGILYTWFILILCTISSTVFAQTYIQGQGVVSFYEIAKSSIIDSSTRLSMTEASSSLNKIFKSSKSFRKESNLSGEYFSKDGLLINIMSRKYAKPNEYMRDQYLAIVKKNLESGYEAKGEPDHSAPYHSVIKYLNGFQVLITYVKQSKNKSFFIIDDSGKYFIGGTIYAKSEDKEDITKAETFVDTLVNSITFK